MTCECGVYVRSGGGLWGEGVVGGLEGLMAGESYDIRY